MNTNGDRKAGLAAHLGTNLVHLFQLALRFLACLLNLFVHREILYKFIPIQHQKHLLFGSMVLFDCLEYCKSSVRCSMMSQCCLIVSHCDKLFRDVPQIKLALGFPLSPFPQSSIFPTVVSQLLSDFWA